MHSPDVGILKCIIEAMTYEDSEHISEAGGRAFESRPGHHSSLRKSITLIEASMPSHETGEIQQPSEAWPRISSAFHVNSSARKVGKRFKARMRLLFDSIG